MHRLCENPLSIPDSHFSTQCNVMATWLGVQVYLQKCIATLETMLCSPLRHWFNEHSLQSSFCVFFSFFCKSRNGFVHKLSPCFSLWALLKCAFVADTTRYKSVFSLEKFPTISFIPVVPTSGHTFAQIKTVHFCSSVPWPPRGAIVWSKQCLAYANDKLTEFQVYGLLAQSQTCAQHT